VTKRKREAYRSKAWLPIEQQWGGHTDSSTHAQDHRTLDVALDSLAFDGLLRRSEAADLRYWRTVTPSNNSRRSRKVNEPIRREFAV